MANKQFKQGTNVLNDLIRQCYEDSVRWFGDLDISNLPHQSLGMCGEAGEFANVVKKIDRGDLDIRDAATKVRLAEELADVFTYLLNICAITNIDLEKAYMGVRANNERRFSVQREKREKEKKK